MSGNVVSYIDEELKCCVSSLPNAKAYYVSESNGSVNELIIEPKYL